jgi:HSP20 family protein
MGNILPAFESETEFFSGWVPAMDVYENNESLLVKVELPGMKKEDIDISIHEGVLSVSGESKCECNNAQTEINRSERNYGRFHRSFSLPKPVAVEKVSAQYKDGILTVTLPKMEEAKPRQIEVKVA